MSQYSKEPIVCLKNLLCFLSKKYNAIFGHKTMYKFLLHEQKQFFEICF